MNLVKRVKKLRRKDICVGMKFIVREAFTDTVQKHIGSVVVVSDLYPDDDSCNGECNRYDTCPCGGCAFDLKRSLDDDDILFVSCWAVLVSLDGRMIEK